MEVVISAEQLRKLDLGGLKEMAQQLGISLAGLEDRESALYTRLMQHAVEVEPID
jgi:hypothetical protein